MGRQGTREQAPPPGTGQEPPELNQRRSERGDAVVPKQNEPAVAEADSEGDPRWPAALRLVEKGKHRDEAQLQAQHQTKPTDNPWDTEIKNTQNADGVTREKAQNNSRKRGKSPKDRCQTKERPQYKYPQARREGRKHITTETNGRAENEQNEPKQATERQRGRKQTQQRRQTETGKGKTSSPNQMLTNQSKEPCHR